uniref:Tektin n=1 Tax=Chelonoidis abingdonii TaxID=106734 RepID=A0A8C0J8C8_CHEAB
CQRLLRPLPYLTEEWHQHNYAQYHQAFADRDGSERCRHESQSLAAYAAALAQRTQEDSTAKLGQRLQDTPGSTSWSYSEGFGSNCLGMTKGDPRSLPATSPP